MNLEQILENRKILQSNVNWTDWKFQLRNRIQKKDLHKYFLLSKEELIGIDKSIRLNVSTTPFYLMLSDPIDVHCPIRRTIVPRIEESILSPEESPDPLHEERLSLTKGLTQMYPDRALLFVNQKCSVYCRFCMRGRKVSYNFERVDKNDLKKSFDYLRTKPEISDVVISGGDPFTLSDSRLEFILSNLHSISSIKICRIGTRIPASLPFRITDDLCQILEKYNDNHLSIFCNVHFNHEKECTQESKSAILKLLKAGVSVGNQTVLLKGINDKPETMLSLHRSLLQMRVRAYYLYDAELVPGSRGFRVPLQRGIEIVQYMRGKIAGMGIPQFVNDLPGGGGKITLNPNWYLGFHKKTREHVFQSAVYQTYHKSPEPIESTYDDKYPEIDEQFYETIKDQIKTAHKA